MIDWQATDARVRVVTGGEPEPLADELRTLAHELGWLRNRVTCLEHYNDYKARTEAAARRALTLWERIAYAAEAAWLAIYLAACWPIDRRRGRIRRRKPKEAKEQWP